MDDPFVPADLATWYTTDRGFHFYAAGLRRLGETERPPQPGGRAGELAEYLACLDSAAAHVRDADGIETVVLPH
jgi:hypothetical protein